MTASEHTVRGCPVLVETAGDVPLVWTQIAVRGGSSADPLGEEGLTRHMAELARRGAGERDRAALDRALDQMGASVSVGTGRDWFTIHTTCLARHLDATMTIAADVLAAPVMADDEHDKLVREARFALDELRDDDASVLQRFFQRAVARGHLYGRTSLGTAASLDALTVERARERYRRALTPANLVIGFAGDIDPATAERAAHTLLARLPEAEPEPAADVRSPIPLGVGRQCVIVDKPERFQAQISIGHGLPPYGSEDFDALTVVEALFGGAFTSRLTQEIRAKRGWSYGAGCVLSKPVGPSWLRMYLAPATEVAPDALALTLQLFEVLVADGVEDDELAFFHSYLRGSWAFQRATPRSRLRQRMHAVLSGLGQEFVDRWPERMAAVSKERANAAICRHFHPDKLVIVTVATADELLPRLRETPGEDALGEITIEPYDSY